MSVVKSFSVGNGDMFYIKHDSDNFTIIDCNMDDTNKKNIVSDIQVAIKDKRMRRFISTHPDKDHITGLKYLDEQIGLWNFYCVKNKATKSDDFEDFDYYCKLRDSDIHYYLYKNCERKWMNKSDKNDKENHGSAGINCLWPVENNEDFKNALDLAEEGKAYNNLSPVLTYSLNNGVKVMWMGDIEKDFLEKIKGEINWDEVDILFAPHHGRDSGKVPSDVLKKLNPSLIIIGESPSQHINYYTGYNTITQNSAGDIVFICEKGWVHIYISSESYNNGTSFLTDKSKKNDSYGNYIGSLETKEK